MRIQFKLAYVKSCDNRGFTLALTDEVLTCDKIY